jgi:hypothetical protein
MSCHGTYWQSNSDLSGLSHRDHDVGRGDAALRLSLSRRAGEGRWITLRRKSGLLLLRFVRFYPRPREIVL